MTEYRTFIKLHDGIADHPKIEPLSDAAFRLLITSWCWCSKHEQDGKMPVRVWERRGTRKARQELQDAGLVIPAADAVEFHDYLKHQQSAEQRRAAREQRRSAGKAGGLARGKRAASGSLSESPSEIQAEVEVEVEEEKKASPSGPRKRATSAPDLFPITPDLAAWGREHAPLVTDPQAETARFLDHHRAKGSLMKDWNAAWRTWMGNAQKFALRDAPPVEARREPAWMRR